MYIRNIKVYVISNSLWEEHIEWRANMFDLNNTVAYKSTLVYPARYSKRVPQYSIPKYVINIQV
jgi:hypothetical protein